MTSFKVTYLYIFILLISFTFTACNESSPSEPDPNENLLEIDTALLGTWKLVNWPKTITFSRASQTEGSGISIAEDFNKWCDDPLVGYYEEVRFTWTQIKINPDWWSTLYYDELYKYECDGAESFPPLAFEYSYLIEGDTLFWGGRQSYSTYVKVD